jgi:2-dehydro-3-deoxygalactonokinase
MALRDEARLIALDWGTSVCRAYLLGGGGEVLAERRLPSGIMARVPVADGDDSRYEQAFEATFERLCSDWLVAVPEVPVIACGMVGSNHGWAEAEYRHVPTDLLDPAVRFTKVETRAGATMHIVPGLVLDGGTYDVMRGEETQILGALGMARVGLATAEPTLVERAVLLPGTHSKWVRVAGTTVVDFVTCMTGEFYGWLTSDSTVSRLARRPGSADWAAFDRGFDVAVGPGGGRGITSTAFSARSLVMAGRLGSDQVHDYVSGLLIGHELAGVAVPWLPADGSPVLVCGDEKLSGRYIRGLHRLGRDAVFAGGGCAPAGMWLVAVASGLVAPGSGNGTVPAGGERGVAR